MKNILIIISLFLFNIINAQNGDITYIVTPTVIDKSSKLRTKIDNELELMSFNLVFDKNKSFFKKNKNVPKNESDFVIASILLGSDISSHQFAHNKKTIYISEISNTTYRVADTTRMNNWVLTNQSKIIEDYECYKASLTIFNERSQKNYTIDAWYAPVIPVPYGPAGYGGLPGLILELKNKHGYIFTPESIKLNVKKIEIPELEEGNEISIKEQLLLRKKERKVTED